MFKLKFIIFLVILCMAPHSHAELNIEPIEKEVMASFESLVQASQDLDSDGYFEHIDAEKFVGLNSDGTNWNSINDLKPLIEGGFAFVEKVILLEFTNVKISVINQSTAILVNEYKQSMKLKNGNIVNVAGGGTQVWSNQQGRWKLVSISASNKP